MTTNPDPKGPRQARSDEGPKIVRATTKRPARARYFVQLGTIRQVALREKDALAMVRKYLRPLIFMGRQVSPIYANNCWTWYFITPELPLIVARVVRQ